jgi:WD40 repeat protein/DNA-binding SARP family transcriptional activator
VGIGVLGPLMVDGSPGGLAPRDRVVLSVLAMQAGEVVPSGRLADALWGERPPPSWGKVLQGCVVRLRKVLGAAAIETVQPPGYRLVLPPEEVDAVRFERLVGRGRELLTLGEPERAAYLLGEALALWRGAPLAELENWDAGQVEARRLVELRLDAEELQLETMLRAGRYGQLLGGARRLVEQAPLRERRWALLALAQYQGGRQAEALRTLGEVRAVLARELGLDPGPELAGLEQAILRQDPALVAGAALPEPRPTCPYRGLVPYDVGDADDFYGRGEQVASGLRRLAAVGALIVTGPSGSGKSSLVRAGLGAALERDGRRVVVVTPGSHPLDALTVLPRTGTAPVLVVDQCEEAVWLCTDPVERADFFAALTGYADRAPLMVVVRADRLGDLSAYPGFARLVERGLFLLAPMSTADLRAAIEGPARGAGLRLEAGLTDLLVREVEGEPGALPLLSHALRATWERREGHTLTVAGYQDAGGIRGAVAQSAETVYQQVAADQRGALRDLLLRLVAPNPDGDPMRNRLPRRLIAGDTDHERLIETLVRARLVTADDGVVEIAHEALARAWPRLREWLEEDVEGQRILRHLVTAADTWDAMGRPDAEVYRGVRLARVVEWRDRRSPELTAVEQDFIDAGRRLERDELRAAVTRAEQQRRVNRRLRGVLVAATVLLVAAIIAGLLAGRATTQARAEAERADAAARSSEARRLGARALVTGDISLSLLLAAAGYRLDPSPQTQANLLAALARKPELIGSTPGRGGELTQLAVAPDGATVAVQDSENRVWLHDARSGAVVSSYDGGGRSRALDNNAVYPVAFSPVDPVLAVGMQTLDPLPVRLQGTGSLRTAGRQLGGMPTQPSRAVDIAYSGDGRFLAASFQHFRRGRSEEAATSASVMVWRLSSPGRPVLQVPLSPAWMPQHVALTRDGARLYTSVPLRVYDVPAGRLLRMAGDAYFWRSLDLSPTGDLLAMPDGDSTSDILLIDAATLTVRRRLSGHRGFVHGVRFSHDGRLLATSSLDRTVIVWDVQSGRRAHTLQADDAWVIGLGFSPDDDLLYTGGRDRAVRTWDLAGDRRYLARLVHADPVGGVARPDPTGRAVAYVHVEPGVPHGRLVFLDLESGRGAAPLQIGALALQHSTGSWHPEGRWFATPSSAGFLRVWDPRSNRLRRQTRPADGPISALDYSPDGRRIVYAELTGRVSMVDADTLEPAGRTIQLDHPVVAVAAGTNGTALALYGGPPASPQFDPQADRWALLDMHAGRILRSEPAGFTDAQTVDVSPDGHQIAIGGREGKLVILDSQTGEPVRPPVSGHDDGILHLTYNHDGSRVLSSAADGTVNLWDTASAQLLGTVALPDRDFLAGGFRPDSDNALITTWTSGVYAWDTRIERALEFACQVAGRDLTDSEWVEHFGDRPRERICPPANDQ